MGIRLEIPNICLRVKNELVFNYGWSVNRGQFDRFYETVKGAYPSSDQMIILVAAFHKYRHKRARTYIKQCGAMQQKLESA